MSFVSQSDCNLARHLHVDAESALTKANKKFAEIFGSMEKVADARGESSSDLELCDLDRLWDQVKTSE